MVSINHHMIRLKNAFISNNIDPKYFIDIELAQEKNISDSAKDLITKINSVNTINDVKPFGSSSAR